MTVQHAKAKRLRAGQPASAEEQVTIDSRTFTNRLSIFDCSPDVSTGAITIYFRPASFFLEIDCSVETDRLGFALSLCCVSTERPGRLIHYSQQPIFEICFIFRARSEKGCLHSGALRQSTQSNAWSCGNSVHHTLRWSGANKTNQDTDSNILLKNDKFFALLHWAN